MAAASGKATSAWNAAGTWEERDFTKWGIARLKETYSQVEMEAGGRQWKVDHPSVTGDAGVVFVRGKKRVAYDLVIELNVTCVPEELSAKLRIETASDDSSWDGKLSNVRGGQIKSAEQRSVAKEMATALRPSFDEFVAELREK
mmetsp:Transcript_18542/g.71577  ORF Transcript_18542/g.71577 Transcript_18542/m.71577 type:complete len:144 (-) Transcript_18542:123-554(-)